MGGLELCILYRQRTQFIIRSLVLFYKNYNSACLFHLSLSSISHILVTVLS